MSQDYLRDEIYPAIYSGYPAVLDGICSARGEKNDVGKQRYLQYLREGTAEEQEGPAEKLWREYQRQDISVDYSRREYQEVYLLRYFFPYSLLVPSVLRALSQTEDFQEQVWELFDWLNVRIYVDDLYYHYLDNRLLTASFFASGPCPELYGLMHYLKGSRITRISAAMFDLAPVKGSQFYFDLKDFRGTKFPVWEFGRVIVFESLLNQIRNPSLYKIPDFESDLTVEGSGFLQPASEKWVKNSDLIVIQCCLNEIPVSKRESVLRNVTHTMSIMKPGALMLIIERSGFPKANKLLRDIQSRAEEFEDVQTHSKQAWIRTANLNNEYIPQDLKSHLFSGEPDHGRILATKIDYHWLAIFKW